MAHWITRNDCGVSDARPQHSCMSRACVCCVLGRQTSDRAVGYKQCTRLEPQRLFDALGAIRATGPPAAVVPIPAAASAGAAIGPIRAAASTAVATPAVGPIPAGHATTALRPIRTTTSATVATAALGAIASGRAGGATTARGPIAAPAGTLGFTQRQDVTLRSVPATAAVPTAWVARVCAITPPCRPRRSSAVSPPRSPMSRAWRRGPCERRHCPDRQ